MDVPVEPSSAERAEPRIDMRMKTTLIAFAIAIACPAGAQNLIVSDTTEYLQQAMEERHAACKQDAFYILILCKCGHQVIHSIDNYCYIERESKEHIPGIMKGISIYQEDKKESNSY